MKKGGNMKKTICAILAVILMAGLISAGPVLASASFSVTGPGTIRAGDNIRIIVNANGSGLFALMGKISFNTAQLTYTSGTEELSGWSVDLEESGGEITFFASDDDLDAPINSDTAVFSLNFTVRNTVSEGDTIAITARDLEASDGISDFFPAETSYRRQVSRPLSSNNNLRSLLVSNGDISPQFSPGTTNYTATVPFSVTRLEITATADDNNASVSLSNPGLNVGSNTVSITVTAENGSQKTYRINVTREQDPDYVAASNGKLQSLIPGEGILSPPFDPDERLYYVYLPYEIDRFDARGEPQDPKAVGVESEEIELEVGENEFNIYGIAEDGTREKYTVIVVRMPQVGMEIKDTSSPDPQETQTPVEKITIQGTIFDSDGNPLANKILELNSDPVTTTSDEEGRYRFENVTEGEYTLYVKEEDGTVIASMPLKITYGMTTRKQDDGIIVSGDTTLDLTVSDTGIQIKNVSKTGETSKEPVQETTTGGIPWWAVVIIILISAGIGFAVGRFAFPRIEDEERSERIIF